MKIITPEEIDDIKGQLSTYNEGFKKTSKDYLKMEQLIHRLEAAKIGQIDDD